MRVVFIVMIGLLSQAALQSAHAKEMIYGPLALRNPYRDTVGARANCGDDVHGDCGVARAFFKMWRGNVIDLQRDAEAAAARFVRIQQRAEACASAG